MNDVHLKRNTLVLCSNDTTWPGSSLTLSLTSHMASEPFTQKSRNRKCKCLADIQNASIQYGRGASDELLTKIKRLLNEVNTLVTFLLIMTRNGFVFVYVRAQGARD